MKLGLTFFYIVSGIIVLIAIIYACFKQINKNQLQNQHELSSGHYPADREQTVINIYPTNNRGQTDAIRSYNSMSRGDFYSSQSSTLQSGTQPPSRNTFLTTNGSPQLRQTSLTELPPSYVELFNKTPNETAAH